MFRTLLIAPMAFPGVVTVLLWAAMYEPNNGVINRVLRSMGLGVLAQNWVGDPQFALLSLLFIGFPFVAGLPFLVFLTTLQNVSTEVFEAAALDGCGRLRRLVAIDLPLMASQLKLLVFLADDRCPAVRLRGIPAHRRRTGQRHPGAGAADARGGLPGQRLGICRRRCRRRCS